MLLKPHYERKIMDKTTIIKTLRDMAKYPTVTLPRDTEALRNAADLLEQAQQAEPVAFASHGVVNWIADKQFQYEADLYTSPPPRQPWVGLTDVEWMNIVNKDHAWFGHRPEDVAHEVAKLVEAKLKEKNT
jgi:hypothetical protein